MSEQIDDLLERLQGLNREEVLEAALALGKPSGAEEVAGPEVEAFIAELEAEPYEAVADVEQLARTALIAAALDPEYRDGVQEVVDRVGRRAFIFGGVEIVAAGVVAVALLQTVLAKGRTSEEETVEIEFDDEGRPRVTRKRKTIYGLSPRIGRLLAPFLSRGEE